ncbi:NADH-quinone oxidoreductase subunit C [Nonomuraea angiospora]|uniref:NADH-quinone oxidoreductase subunit C n=1 Tax=Nonomuraea angiospora TaxID=46172 RepID=UPI0033EDBA00
MTTEGTPDRPDNTPEPSNASNPHDQPPERPEPSPPTQPSEGSGTRPPEGPEPRPSAQPTDNGTQQPTPNQPPDATGLPGGLTQVQARFGDRAEISESYGDTTIDVAPADWIELLTFVRDDLGYAFFDWLTGVDDPPEAFLVVAHVYNLTAGARLLLRTRVPRENPHLPTAVGVYRGANWHERETYEMFGVIFDDHPYLVPLLLPDGFEGHPLRKDFILAARVAKPWPGAKEPGESGHGAPSRRKTLPPGVPADWGPPDA